VLELSLSQQFCLVLLSLDPHHLKLKHLHLHLSLRHHVGSESWAERQAIGVHSTSSLVLGKAIVGSVDGSGHGDVAIVEHVVLGHLCDLIILLLLWEDSSVLMEVEARNVECTGWSGGVGHGGGRRADAACAETSEKRGTIAGVCGSHCFVFLREKIDNEESRLRG